MRTRAIAITVVIVASIAGCEAEAAQVGWSFELGDACVAASTTRLNVRIHHDGCFGETVIWTEDLDAERTMTDTPDLEPGRYGLEVRAFDSADRVVGRGCIDVHLPLRGDGVILTVHSDDPTCGRTAGDAGPLPNDAGPVPIADGGHSCADDGLECTSELAAGDECLHVPVPGWCAIDGACWPNGARRPDNPCQMCDTKLAESWWTLGAGSACGDGGTCDERGMCR